MATSEPTFGIQRLHRSGTLERFAFRLFGVADPAHWLHFRYFQRALALWPRFSPRRILDAGCGRGDFSVYLAQRFPGAEVVGADVDAERVAVCQAAADRMGLSNVRYRVQDLTRLDPREQFDLIVSVDVLEHIVDQQMALLNLASALAPGGRFYFHIPTIRTRPVPLSPWLKKFHEWAEREHLADDLTAEQFVERVRQAGLTPAVEWRTFAYRAGELATSLFALPYANTLLNRLAQISLIPVCRVLVMADHRVRTGHHYAVAVAGSR
jgi:trans-aconitate methyltransferase